MRVEQDVDVEEDHRRPSARTSSSISSCRARLSLMSTSARAIAVEHEPLERLVRGGLAAAVKVGAQRVFDLLRERRAARGGALLGRPEDLVIEPDRGPHAQEHPVGA
jgi:hypothetical protein